MEILNVKDWLKIKDAQFEIVAEGERGFGDRRASIIKIVLRIKDKMIFGLGQKFDDLHYPDLYMQIMKFHEDLKNVTFIIIKKNTIGEMNQVLEESTFEIDSIQIESGKFVRALQKL